jgi:hypothetical protein
VLFDIYLFPSRSDSECNNLRVDQLSSRVGPAARRPAAAPGCLAGDSVGIGR